MWHLPQFLKRLELLIKPSGFGYNAYNQVVVVKIPNQIINYLTEDSDIGFVDVEGNYLYCFSKKFSLGTNEVEYYVKLETIDDLNYTSLFVYYDIFTEIIFFEDDFESGSLDTSKWTNIYTSYAGVSTHTANSGVYSMYTTRIARVESKVINLEKYNIVFVYCWIRRGSDAFSEDPDSGEDIVVEYLNNSSSWKQLDIFYGNGTPGQIYNINKMLPVDALHSGFKFRFRQTSGGSGNYDYWHIDDVTVCSTGTSNISYIFDGAYIVNYLSETDLISVIGPNFSNHGSVLHQPTCDTYAAKTTGGITYISCSISKSSFTLFLNCYLLSGSGYLVYFSSSNYVYVNADGSLVARINGSDYTVGSRLYFNVCSTFGITCDGNNTYIVINGLTKLVIKQTFSITELCLGGNGVSGYSVECYFFDLFLLPTKLPLYSYYLHNTIYNYSEFFRESGYDNIVVSGYLTNWPDVIFSGDQAVFRSNIDILPGWNYYRLITITNSGTASVYDYNVLVTLCTSDIGNPYNNINADGSDIYFTSVSGEPLQYCLYSWDNTGDSEIIVNIDGEIPIGDLTIYMYYGAEDAVSCSTELEYVYYYSDSFDTKNTNYWTFDPVYQEVPCTLSGENVLKMWSNGHWHSFYNTEYGIVSGMEVSIEFLRTGLSSWHMASVEYDGTYHRWCIQESGGNLRVQYRINAQSWVYPKTLISSAKIDIWYVALLRVDDINGFYMRVWEKDNPAIYGEYTHTMPVGLSWRFRSHQYQNVSSYHDNYKVFCTAYPEEIFTSVSGEVSLSGTLIDIQENIYKEYINYSVSFNNGSSWYVSGLDPTDVFFKDFSSHQVLDTILRIDYNTDYIDKYYTLVINDFNMFDVSVDSDFTVGELDNYCLDTETEFTTALPTIYDVKVSPVEFIYDTSASGFKSLYWDRPVEISWGGAVGSGTISKEVEYCFDIIIYSWCDDTEVEFWLGELLQLYHVDYDTYFTLESGHCSYINTSVDFSLANWDYFPHSADIICSVVDHNCQDTEVTVGSGSLVRFISDIKASDEEYVDFSSSVFCSLSGTPTNYSYDVQIISGSLVRYNSDIYCSLLNANNNFGAEIKLNTVVINNFNIESNVIESTNFCFSVDVYDTHYGVTTSGIQVYMNTNIITGNEVTNKTFSDISSGHTTYWCYDVGSLSPMEYIEIVVKGTNTYGDLNIASYFLRYGKRYNYNLYHIIQHEYETLIPMLMVAENNVDIFPSFSTETMYVRVENYKRSSLSASIFGVGLYKSSLPAEVMALTNNFYNGGHYTVRVECRDLAGNIMDPLEFEFTIRQDGL